MASCTEKFGDTVDGAISGLFGRLGLWVGRKPRYTILISVIVTMLCGIGYAFWTTENRAEELWVPQDTVAEAETQAYRQVFPPTARFNTMIVQSSSASSTSAAAAGDENSSNVLTKEHLVAAMKVHQQIATNASVYEDESYTLTDLCAPGFSCANSTDGVCQCLILSILTMWNYDMETLQADDDVMTTLQSYGSRDDLKAVLGNSQWDGNTLLSAQAFTLSYFLQDRSMIVDGGTKTDPINAAWEKDVYLSTLETAVPTDTLEIDYFATRSFGDVFGDDISGDLLLVQVSYVVAFLFLGATMGKIVCGTGSRWTLALGALFTVGLSTAAGFGLSSLFGLFFGPVHSLLPFVLLGIGVDDAFVIVNAFNRERNVSRKSENNTTLAERSRRALSRAGASISVTSMTDLVAFAISSSSALPALASFCGYAAISIFFLWVFASTFFTATMVLDERRQRDNRRECLCCVTRKKELDDDDDEPFQEGLISRYFRNYHAPAILSRAGKVVVLLGFAAMLSYGFYGAINLSVEDSERAFVPADSYVTNYLSAADEYFPEQGIDLFITFEQQQQGSDDTSIYANRQALAELDTRVTGLSTAPPYISEPVSEQAYRNVMTGLSNYLAESGTDAIGGATLGDDGWPTTEEDFVSTLALYANVQGPGAMYAQDVAFNENKTAVEAFRVNLEYIKLVKEDNNGEIMDDADKLIEAMDSTRDMVNSWSDLPPAFPYSDKFLAIEGFKIIRRELFLNVGLAIAAVGVIVFFTVASPMTALLITLNVAFCIIEILGFMYAAGIVIDSVSVINIVLAVGLSVDYSAHIGHCFMVKGGDDKNARVTESLADIGASVLQGATSTFLAVAVLLFSSSYVFVTLSKQFALTVILGIAHGLLLLPVLLSLLGPKAFSSAEVIEQDIDNVKASKPNDSSDKIGETAHQSPEGSDEESEAAANKELPPGWAQVTDPASGDVYYYNSDTGETSWDLPGGDDTKASKANDSDKSGEAARQSPEGGHEESELPPGWSQVTDPASGDLYYYNSDTGETSWDRPDVDASEQ